MRLVLVAFLFLFTTSLPAKAIEGRDYASSIEYSSAWSCNGKLRFNWYCDDEEEKPQQIIEGKQEKSKQKTPEEQALEELTRLQKELEAKRALAVLYPTPENVKTYIAAQQQVIERSALFTDVWRRVLWQSPELGFDIKDPMNNSAIMVKKQERDRKEQQTMIEIAKEWGLFFFFRSDCPFCKHMVPTLQWIMRNYDMTILPVSLDGSTIEGLPPAVRNNGIAERLGVDVVPLYVLGNVKTGKLIIVGSGVLSLHEIVGRIYVLTQTQPGDL